MLINTSDWDNDDTDDPDYWPDEEREIDDYPDAGHCCVCGSPLEEDEAVSCEYCDGLWSKNLVREDFEDFDSLPF